MIQQFGKYRTIGMAGGVLAGLFVIAHKNYLLFHTLAEMFSIVVACGVFMLVWNAGRFMENSCLLFLGIAYFFVGGVDLLHTLSYKGLGVFESSGSNLATQLWIGGRYIESVSLLVAPCLLGRKLRLNLVFFCFCAVTALLFLSIFYWQVFPTCFVEGAGLTPFKKSSEYIISAVLVAAIVLLLRRRGLFERRIFGLLIASIVMTIASELLFTMYEGPYDILNQIGHILKLVSFYLIYKAILQTGIVKPYVALVEEMAERRHLEKAILEISDREQRRIGQELHDSIGQLLAGIALMIKVLQQRLPARHSAEASYAAKIGALVDKTTNQTRHLAKRLSPMELEEGGLTSALEELAANTEDFGVSCTFTCGEPTMLNDAAVAKNVYRIAQEAISNAIKHGKAQHIRIELTHHKNLSRLTVESDGLGFPEAGEHGKGMGLSIMNYRARVINGSVEIHRGESGGTLVTCLFQSRRKDVNREEKHERTEDTQTGRSSQNQDTDC